jgi:hypothetical protein
MNYSYFYDFCGAAYGVYYLREASFNSEKIVSGPRVSVRSLNKKKINVACPTDKGDPGRLTIVANEGAGPGLLE